MMVGRTELERRGNYMQQIHRLLREGHPLIQMIQHCLKNLPEDRPTIDVVLAFLEAEVQDGESDMSKLELVQTLRQKKQLIEKKEGENQSLSQQLAGKDQIIQSKVDEIQTLSQQKDQIIRLKDDEIRTLSQQKDEVIRSKDQVIRSKDQAIWSKEGEIQQLQSSLDSRLQQIQSLKQAVEVLYV